MGYYGAMSPPTLTRRLLVRQMRLALPGFPALVLKAGLEEIIAALAGALAAGRPVALRGFGRLIPRRYENSPKKVGLIFRPAPGLAARVNKKEGRDR